MVVQVVVYLVVSSHTFYSKKGPFVGLVVSVIAFYTNDPSSNPSEASSISRKMLFWRNENEQKRPGMAHLKKEMIKKLWQWHLIHSYQTQPNLTAIAKAKNLSVSETDRDIFSH